MKKNIFRKMGMVLICLVLVVTSPYTFNVVSAENTPDFFFAEDYFVCEEFIAEIEALLEEQFGEYFLENYEDAIENHSRMMASFFEINIGDSEQDDYFSNSYINEEGNLVINLLDDVTYNDIESNFFDEEEVNFYGAYIDDDSNLVVYCLEWIWYSTNGYISIETNYPETYGGTFINDDGYLVVFVTDYSFIDELYETAGVYDVIFELVEYSHNELIKTMDRITEFSFNFPEHEAIMNVSAWVLNDRENQIIVELLEFTEENIELFRNYVIDSEKIIFEQGERVTLEVASHSIVYDVNPGMGVAWDRNISAGYRARRGGLNGFVTTGHGTTSGAVVRSNSSSGRRLGFVEHGAWQFSGSVDAAFVRADTGATPTNNLRLGGTLVATGNINPPNNALVTMVGRHNRSVGQISSTSVTVNNLSTPNHPTPRTLTNLTRAGYSSQGGDSGGVVFHTNVSNGNRVVSGIHTLSQGHFTKATEINRAFTLVRY